jgi:glycerol uptake facilitator-like aquaporin
MLLKNRTPSFVVLVTFVTMFVVQIAIRVFYAPPRGRMPSPMAALTYALTSGLCAWVVWAEIMKARKLPTAGWQWARWIGPLLAAVLAFLIYRLTITVGAQ